MIQKTYRGCHASSAQFQIGNYRVDGLFDCNGEAVVVELDGKEFHDVERDRIRDSELLKVVDAVIRIPGSAIRYFRYETFQILGQWYPRFEIESPITVLSVSEIADEIALAKEEPEINFGSWLDSFDKDFGAWEADETTGKVGSIKAFLYDWKKPTITRRLGLGSPVTLDGLYRRKDCVRLPPGTDHLRPRDETDDRGEFAGDGIATNLQPTKQNGDPAL